MLNQHNVVFLAQNGDANALEELFQENPELVNFTDFNGCQPLHLAAASLNPAAVKVCLDALKKRRDLDLKIEVNREDYQVVSLFLTIYPNKNIIKNFTPLKTAFLSGNMLSTRYLLEAGADFAGNKTYSGLLHLAISEQDIVMAKIVLESTTSHSNIDWDEIIYPDLSQSRRMMELLHSYAILYRIKDFKKVCYTLSQEIEEYSDELCSFTTFLVQDALVRWPVKNKELNKCYGLLTSLSLSISITTASGFDLMKFLHTYNVFTPKWTIWLNFFQEIYTEPSISNEFSTYLFQFITTDGVPAVSCEVLLLAFLTTRFPSPDWFSDWKSLVIKTELSNSTIAIDDDQLFWLDIFPIILSRATSLMKQGKLDIDCASNECNSAIDALVKLSPNLKPTSTSNLPCDAVFDLFSYWVTYEYVDYNLLVRVSYRQLLPYCRDSHVFHVPTLLIDRVCDYQNLTSQSLANDLMDYSPLITACLIDLDCSEFTYSFLTLLLYELEAIQPLLSPSVSIIIDSLRHFRSNLNPSCTQPLELNALCKLRVRACLRRRAVLTPPSCTRMASLGEIIDQLPVSIPVKQYLKQHDTL